MKIGISEKTLLALLHPDAIEMYHVCSDLKTICDKLQDPNVRMAAMDVELFRPFQPMLAAPTVPEEVVKLFGGPMSVNRIWAEVKLDGERVIIHIKDGEYRFWSRYVGQCMD